MHCFYVIKRLDQGGGYVTPPDSDRSYTQNPLKARRFHTYEEAKRDCCEGNERVVTIV